jgi:hypothetical protein
MSSSAPTLEIRAVAFTVASLNWSCTLPDGTLGIWKLPAFSTIADRFVPSTVTVSPASAELPAPFTTPAIVAPAAPVEDGEVGPAAPPPQATIVTSDRHKPTSNVRVSISTMSSQKTTKGFEYLELRCKQHSASEQSCKWRRVSLLASVVSRRRTVGARSITVTCA